jgi:two-component system, cell cycle sensor histidine kinase and response regulator CckA
MPSELLSAVHAGDAGALPTAVSVYRLLATIPGAVYRCDFDAPGRVLEVSDGVQPLTGRTPGDFLEGRVSWPDVVHPEDLAATERLLAETMATAAPFVAEYRIIHTDGRPRWVHETAIAVRGTDGRPRFLDGVVVDISDRHVAEDALRESEARYRTAFVTSPDAIILVREADGLVMETNDGFTRMLGYRPDEVVGRHSFDVGLWSDAADRDRFLVSMRRDGFCSNFETRFRLKDGSVKTGLISAHFIERQGERCILSITRDISAREEAEERQRMLERQLQQAQKLESLGVLAGGVAHDFNNILMAILGYTELALEDVPAGSQTVADLSSVKEAAHRAADLCRQLLAYAGKASFDVEPVDLGRVVAEMIDLLKSSVSKKARLHVRVDPGLPKIAADPAQLRQVLLNLVVNASEALGNREGDVTVSVRSVQCDEQQIRALDHGTDLPPGSYIRLEVADTGCGMAPDTHARVFEPFYSTKFSGRGLGLPAVLGIVRAHHGGIEVRTERASGTSVGVLLPSLVPDADGPGRTAAEWRGRGTVLFVDDEDSVRTVGCRMLSRLGYQVLTAADGRQAVEVYRRHGSAISLVILDLTMPRLDGVQAFEELRRLNPAVRVILASGYSEKDVASRVPRGSIAGVLQKPYTIERMKALLQELG